MPFLVETSPALFCYWCKPGNSRFESRPSLGGLGGHRRQTWQTDQIGITRRSGSPMRDHQRARLWTSSTARFFMKRTWPGNDFLNTHVGQTPYAFPASTVSGASFASPATASPRVPSPSAFWLSDAFCLYNSVKLYRLSESQSPGTTLKPQTDCAQELN